MIKKRMTAIEKNLATLINIDQNINTLSTMLKKPLTEGQNIFLKFLLVEENLLYYITKCRVLNAQYFFSDFTNFCPNHDINRVTKFDCLNQTREEIELKTDIFWKPFFKFLHEFQKIRISVKSKSIKIIDNFSVMNMEQNTGSEIYPSMYLFVDFDQRFLNLWMDICGLVRVRDEDLE